MVRLGQHGGGGALQYLRSQQIRALLGHIGIPDSRSRRAAIFALRLQSRLGSALSTISSQTENASAAASRIEDVDVAGETAELLKAQILQQAASAILAQANQAPALALELLR